MLRNGATCAYEKWIGVVTNQPLMYVPNPKKVAATSGMVRAHETLKATAIGAFAENLKTKFQSWKEKDDWGASCDCVWNRRGHF
jgi:hypothetical protein